MSRNPQTMARALALEAGEFFDGLAEAEKDFKPAELTAAADYANQVAEQLRELAGEIEEAMRAKRENKRAKWRTEEDGTMVRVKGSLA